MPVPRCQPPPHHHHHHHQHPWRPPYHPTGYDVLKAVAFTALARELTREAASRGRINLTRSSVVGGDLCMVLEALKTYNYPMGTVLDLSFNNIGDLGCMYIADALRSGRCPLHLNIILRSCGIGITGCRHLADALSHPMAPAYCAIDVSHNAGVGPRGVNAFVSASMRPVSAQKRWSVRVSPREVIRPYVPNTPTVRRKARVVGPLGLMALGFGAAAGAITGTAAGIGRLFSGGNKNKSAPAAAAAPAAAQTPQQQLEQLYATRQQLLASGVCTADVDTKILVLGGTVPDNAPPQAARSLAASSAPTPAHATIPSAPPAPTDDIDAALALQAAKAASLAEKPAANPAKLAELEAQMEKLRVARETMSAAGLSTTDVDNSISSLEIAKQAALQEAAAPSAPPPVCEPAGPDAASTLAQLEEELAKLVHLKATLESLSVPTAEVDAKIASVSARRTELVTAKIAEIEARAAKLDEQITSLTAAKESLAGAGLPTGDVDAKIAAVVVERDDLLASAPRLGVTEQPEDEAHKPSDADPPQALLCGISRELMTDPVTVNGRNYERANFVDYLRSSERKVCPADNTTPVTEADMKPNAALLKEIQTWLAAHPEY